MARTPRSKPETEIKLEELQECYIADPTNQDNFNRFFILLKAYARSLVLKEIKSKIYLDPDHVDGVATEAVLKLLNQYKKDGWRVWGSFAGVLRWKVVEALYEDCEEDSSQSLNMLIGDGNVRELGDILTKVGASPLWKHESDDPQENFFKNFDSSASEILGVLKESSEALPYRLAILFHAYLLLRLRRPKTRLTLPAFKQYFLDTKEEEAFELLLLEIRNRISQHAT